MTFDFEAEVKAFILRALADAEAWIAKVDKLGASARQDAAAHIDAIRALFGERR